MKMDEEKFFEAVQGWEDEESLASSCDRERRSLAARLGIELTAREEDMLPCPWCGTTRHLAIGPFSGYFCCGACQAAGPGEAGGTRSQAIAAWNRRAPTPKLPTREELALLLYAGMWPKDRFSKGGRVPKVVVKNWIPVADAAFRAFGLTPPGEED